jgi:hypothetical protein
VCGGPPGVVHLAVTRCTRLGTGVLVWGRSVFDGDVGDRSLVSPVEAPNQDRPEGQRTDNEPTCPPEARSSRVRFSSRHALRRPGLRA